MNVRKNNNNNNNNNHNNNNIISPCYSRISKKYYEIFRKLRINSIKKQIKRSITSSHGMVTLLRALNRLLYGVNGVCMCVCVCYGSVCVCVCSICILHCRAAVNVIIRSKTLTHTHYFHNTHTHTYIHTHRYLGLIKLAAKEVKTTYYDNSVFLLGAYNNTDEDCAPQTCLEFAMNVWKCVCLLCVCGVEVCV